MNAFGMHGMGGKALRGIAEERPPGAAIDWKVVLRVLTYTRPYAAKRNAVFILTALRAAQKPATADGQTDSASSARHRDKISPRVAATNRVSWMK